MILELILSLGLLFVLAIVVLLHIVSTSTSPEIAEMFNVTANDSSNKELHPWFMVIEAILILSLAYIVRGMWT